MNCGALLWTMPAGAELERAERQRIAEWRPSGAVLFRENLLHLEQVRQLVADLQTVSEGSVGFIAIDQEGGRVTRLPAPATNFPSPMALAATQDPGLAEAAARATACELRAFGITVNLAPVVDVNANPRNPSIGARSFGCNPSNVARFAAAQVRGYLAGGVLPVAKHFPGKAGTSVDPHLALPVVNDSVAILRQRDLPPFVAAVAAGLPIVMIGHAAFPALAQRKIVPGSLSRGVYDLLRSPEVEFGGLAITDALRMRAVTEQYDLAEAAVLAVSAGADAVLPCASEAEILRRLAEAGESGELLPERIDEALRRQTRARDMLSEFAPPELHEVKWREHADLALTIGRHATTLIADQHGWLPLSTRRPTLLIEFAQFAASQAEQSANFKAESLTELARVLQDASGRRIEHLQIPLHEPAAYQHSRVSAALAGLSTDAQVVVATREASLNPAQVTLVDQVFSARNGRPVIIVAFGSFSNADALEGAPALIATYSEVHASITALVEALFGWLVPRGVSPMALEPANTTGVG
jgi:beta-N-acetylhexosaminidase